MSKPVNKSWRDDWEMFVRDVADCLGRGMHDDEVTQKFAGRRVVWTGTVSGKRLENSHSSVQMDMSAVTVRLGDGRHATVDYLSLGVKKSELRLWEKIEVGAKLHFATQIRQASGPFPGIRWSDLGDQRGLILFLTDGAVPVD